jgi:hypothetical protein
MLPISKQHKVIADSCHYREEKADTLAPAHNIHQVSLLMKQDPLNTLTTLCSLACHNERQQTIVLAGWSRMHLKCPFSPQVPLLPRQSHDRCNDVSNIAKIFMLSGILHTPVTSPSSLYTIRWQQL